MTPADMARMEEQFRQQQQHPGDLTGALASQLFPSEPLIHASPAPPADSLRPSSGFSMAPQATSGDTSNNSNSSPPPGLPSPHPNKSTAPPLINAPDSLLPTGPMEVAWACEVV